MVETTIVEVKWLGVLFAGTKQLLEKVAQNYKRIFAPKQLLEKVAQNYKRIFAPLF